MSPVRRALQGLQFDLNGHRGTTEGRLHIAECRAANRPYVVQLGASCWCVRPPLSARTDTFEFSIHGVELLRAELAGLGWLGAGPSAPAVEIPLTQLAPGQWDGQFPVPRTANLDVVVNRARTYLAQLGALLRAITHPSSPTYVGTPFLAVMLFFHEREDEVVVAGNVSAVIQSIIAQATPAPSLIGPSVWELVRRPWPREEATP